MLIVVVILLALFTILAVVGFAIEGLLWLGVIGVILVGATAVVGLAWRRATRARARDAANGRPR